MRRILLALFLAAGVLAAVAADPAQPHAAAMNSFTAAAQLLGNTRLSGPTVGFVTPSGVFDPHPEPWL